MKVQHSRLLNEFVSFWFETSIDGEVKFDTHLDILSATWHVCEHNRHQILISGSWPKGLRDHQIVRRVSADIDAAIATGAI